jgi:homoserine acetyltransferase
MDLQDLGDGWDGRHTYAEGAARISADTLLVGVKQDALIPPGEMAMLADTINGEGNANATFLEMDSAFGHDAFLKEAEWLGPRVRAHLEAGLEATLAQEAVINTGVNAP